MKKRVLITGGAGFIGSHLADELIRRGHRVRIVDSLVPEVHGRAGIRPPYLSPAAELIVGDVRDMETMALSLQDVDCIFHFAARVGVGQSMYRISEYVGVNDLGTAMLMDLMVKLPVKRLIVASSRDVYGEGLYRSREGQLRDDVVRDFGRLREGQWDPVDASGAPLEPLPTPESKRPSLTSVYALSKFQQEQLCLVLGEAYHVPVVALRFFDVYGPRQSLSNPHAGVVAIFASRLLNGCRPLLFEDGEQQRDFLEVRDAVAACIAAMERPEAVGGVFNIGSGRGHTLREMATQLARVMRSPNLTPELSGKVRLGDVRHCVADVERARRVLGWEPRIGLEEGLDALAPLLRTQSAHDHVMEARAELARRGLTVG